LRPIQDGRVEFVEGKRKHRSKSKSQTKSEQKGPEVEKKDPEPETKTASVVEPKQEDKPSLNAKKPVTTPVGTPNVVPTKAYADAAKTAAGNSS